MGSRLADGSLSGTVPVRLETTGPETLVQAVALSLAVRHRREMRVAMGTASLREMVSLP